MAAKPPPDATADPQHALTAAVLPFLVEFSSLLIAAGVSANTLKELTLRAYVQAAIQATARRNRRPNKAAIAAMTGLSRVEVTRLLTELEGTDAANKPAGHAPQPASRASRVVEGWRSDVAFWQGGQPGVLPVRGKTASFEALVRLYSGDMTPQAMLRELTRLDWVQVDEQGVHLRETSAPQGHLQTLSALIDSLRPILQSVSSVKGTRSDIRATTLDVPTFHPITQKLLLKHLKTAVPRFLETARTSAAGVTVPPSTRAAGAHDRVSISVVVTDTKTHKPRGRT